MPVLSSPAPRFSSPEPSRPVLSPSAGSLLLLLEGGPVAPADDAGVGPALIADVAARGTGGWLRLYRPRPTVGFSRRDSLSPGFGRAVEAASSRGFTPVLRAPGGRAAAYHEDAVCIDLVVADPDPREGASRRFAELAALIVEALATVGVEATTGELPLEYCPGRYSVHAGGMKLAGAAQRVVRGGWYLGAVVLVDCSDAVRGVIGPVYDALGLPCDLRTVGAVADLSPGTTTTAVEHALLAAFSRRLPLDGAGAPSDLASRARAACPRHPQLGGLA